MNSLAVGEATITGGIVTPDTVVQHEVDLIALSFRYAQGSGSFGGRVLAMALQDFPKSFPERKISDSAIEAAVPMVKQIYDKAHPAYLNKDNDITPADVRHEIVKQVRNVDSHPAGSARIKPVAMAETILERDGAFLLETAPQKSRYEPGRLSNGHTSAIDGKFLSHFCHYGLAGRPAGADEYSQMFKAVSSPAIIRGIPGFDWLIVSVERFERILLKHFEHIPEDMKRVPDVKKVALQEIVSDETSMAIGL